MGAIQLLRHEAHADVVSHCNNDGGATSRNNLPLISNGAKEATLKTDNRQQLLFIVAAIGLALLIGDRVIYQPLSASWKERSTRIVDLRKSVADAKAMMEREKNIRSRWSSMRTNTLSTDVSVAEQQMFKAIDQWARDSRITVSSIKPQWKRANEDYMTLECRLDAAGSLDTITRFLYNLEKDPIAVRVESVELAARDTPGTQFALGLQVSGLVLQPQEK